MRLSRLRLPAVAVSLLLATQVSAEPVYGLVTLNMGSVDTSPMYLDRFDSATPGTATTFTSTSQLLLLQGTVSGQTLRSIDFRPADGRLYALSSNGTTAAQLYTVDLMTGVLTTVGGGITLGGNTSKYVSIDFNPVVDRLRVVTGTGFNYRVNPTNGTLAATDTRLNVGGTTSPDQVIGLAYTNNVAGATSTTLYGYDQTADTLDTIGGVNGAPSPNGGMLFDVGDSGLLSDAPYIGLDVDAAGFAFGNVDGFFYSVNLGNGHFTSIGADAFAGTLDIAVQVTPAAAVGVPEPDQLALLGLGALALLTTVRRRRTASRH